MVDYVKQDMKLLWAELGDYVAPTNEKITQGWLVEVPPRQYWNWLENRQDKQLAYLTQKGFAEWDSELEYIINKSYVQYNGVVYKCVRTNTGVVPGTSTLDWVVAFTTSTAASEALKTVTPAANKLPYFTSGTAASTTSLTAFARTILDDADAASVRTTISAQTLNANLTAISGLTSAANKLPYFTGSGTAATTDISAFGRSLIDDVDAAAARNTLGLGSLAVQSDGSINITGGTISGITDLAIEDGGTGASTAAGARANLGLGTAAVANATTSSTDATSGRLLRVGDFGLGAIAGPQVSDCNTVAVNGIYSFTNTTANTPVSASYGSLIMTGRSSSEQSQICLVNTSANVVRMFIRNRYTTTAGIWGEWVEVFHSGNVTPFIQSLLDDEDAATARATLGANNAANLTTGILPDARLSGTYTGVNITGNAATATQLATARTINGVSFNGTTNITIADSTKVPLAGGTMTGTLNAPTFNATSTTGGGFQGIDADTAAAPSFTWTADLDTGVYHPAADVIGFTVGGVERGRIDTTGFSGNGSQLTALNAANVSTGTLAVARGGTGVTTSTGSGSVVLSASPTLTGTPMAPTAAPASNSTQIATTAFVKAALATVSGNTASLAGDGWFKDTSTGMIIQWGTISNTTSSTTNQSFNIAFPTACCYMSFTSVFNSAYNDTPKLAAAPTATTFRVHQSSVTIPLYWFAVGY
jgi:hypothetical protein